MNYILNFMSDTLKNHIHSAIITAITTAGITVGIQLSNHVGTPITSDFLFTMGIVVVRAVVKAVYEKYLM